MRLFAIAILALTLTMAGAAMMSEDTAARAGATAQAASE
jgi:hypothetical protein